MNLGRTIDPCVITPSCWNACVLRTGTPVIAVRWRSSRTSNSGNAHLVSVARVSITAVRWSREASALCVTQVIRAGFTVVADKVWTILASHSCCTDLGTIADIAVIAGCGIRCIHAATQCGARINRAGDTIIAEVVLYGVNAVVIHITGVNCARKTVITNGVIRGKRASRNSVARTRGACDSVVTQRI